MASIYPKGRFWYLQYRDTDGTWKHKSLKLRVGIGSDTRTARQIEADTTSKEREQSSRTSPAWVRWVPHWIDTHFTNANTRLRVQNCWSAIETFLTEHKLPYPSQVQREHAFAYMSWRTKDTKEQGKVVRKKRHHNTALLELKYFAQILGEADKRGYIHKNPFAKPGIKRVPAKEKPPLTDEQIELLQTEFERQDKEFLKKGKPAWMSMCFKIALCHGVRLHETRVPMSDVHLADNLIVFNKTKGNKPFGAFIHPALRPDLEKLKEAKAKVTCETPSQNAAKLFHQIFRRLGIPNCFHSTRVTVVTRLAIAGVDQRLAQLYVNHSSRLVHGIYTKLKPEHAAGAAAALRYPGHESGKPPLPPAQP